MYVGPMSPVMAKCNIVKRSTDVDTQLLSCKLMVIHRRLKQVDWQRKKLTASDVHNANLYAGSGTHEDPKLRVDRCLPVNLPM